MTYEEWFLNQGKQHQNIIKKLEDKNIDEIIDYFKFENMVIKEPNFCLLYKENKKCHDIEDLNCYLCACPSFRFKDIGIKKENNKLIYSFCSINSKKGKFFETTDSIHQDCSDCIVPHKEKYIKKYFNKDWFKIMKDCKI